MTLLVALAEIKDSLIVRLSCLAHFLTTSSFCWMKRNELSKVVSDCSRFGYEFYSSCSIERTCVVSVGGDYCAEAVLQRKLVTFESS